ncbi:Argininosuccinate synthase [Sebaldella termitidis]|uniref:Argininosuccinate synthase n=1 Tax=Sebaldella termitidis (strain ATCC 33386 / NCTC 11300) TaxID=526218 RepID=D1AKK8_SEBTE|nr:argininosuccinate synthase [Sebaldella termitidis]ACZ09124.1 argininosuccinate synthase [Sebaldella termitidis ATCC 33386]SUI24442.1 Argininosuccinate synthase [Sebaldella termitidis]
MSKDKVVLAYSGGLDTSIIIPWLKENYDLEVIACCVNVGQEDDMEEVRKKAVESGATKVYVEDKREEFVRDYAFRGLKAGAVYEHKYLLGTAFARPLIAKTLVDVAHKEDAKYICHGATGKGNDQVRFETGIASFDPELKIIAPWRMWDISSREDAIDYANKHGISVPVTKEKIYSRDQNLWHISHEGGDIEDLTTEHQEDILYLMTTSPEKAKNDPTYVEISFEKGWPVKVDGKALAPVELLETLNKIAGENGVGITDIVENRIVGMKSRGIYETPGGTLLMEALNELECIIFDKDTLNFKKLVSQKYADLTYSGQWFTPLREALDAFVDKVHENATGTIKLKLYKGNIKVAGRYSDYALYSEKISSFGDSGELYSHKDAEGFIKLFSLPNKIRASKK